MGTTAAVSYIRDCRGTFHTMLTAKPDRLPHTGVSRVKQAERWSPPHVHLPSGRLFGDEGAFLRLLMV